MLGGVRQSGVLWQSRPLLRSVGLFMMGVLCGVFSILSILNGPMQEQPAGTNNILKSFVFGWNTGYGALEPANGPGVNCRAGEGNGSGGAVKVQLEGNGGEKKGETSLVGGQVEIWRWEYEDEVADCTRSQGCGLLVEAMGAYKGQRRPPAVAYRGAMWRADIGRWLSSCDVTTKNVLVTEILHQRTCPENCNGRGTCNRELGACRCRSGWKGEACAEDDPHPCNNPPTEKYPLGKFTAAICPGACDLRTSNCYCPPETKYPDRTVCGVEIGFHPKPAGNGPLNYSQPQYEDLLSEDPKFPGWCFADPEKVARGEQMLRALSRCYDGRVGQLCQIPVKEFCFNQCSGNGLCLHGFCLCEGGWYGMDCSIPGAGQKLFRGEGGSPMWALQWFLGEEPPPLESDRGKVYDVDGAVSTLWPEGEDSPEDIMRRNGALMAAASRVEKRKAPGRKKPGKANALGVKRRRPLVYVYDLAAEHNVHDLQRRHNVWHCVNRHHIMENRTLWHDNLYGAEGMIIEGLLRSPHRTTNGEEADFFFVPTIPACYIEHFNDAPGNYYNVGRQQVAMERTREAYEYIMQTYPFWNRTGGKDHIWGFWWDEGACVAPKEIWESTMLVHWGNTAKRARCTTAYGGDVWDVIPGELRGEHPCYDPEKDIVLPAFKLFDVLQLSRRLVYRSYEERTTLFYFNGNLGPEYEPGRVEPHYSWGIRQTAARHFASSENINGSLGTEYTDDVILTNVHSNKYEEELSTSKFCGVFPGDGWSGRLEDSVLHGCIPVIIQDGIHLPYENFLDFSTFAVRIAEADIPNMINILRSIPEDEVRDKLSAVQAIWSRFTYVTGVAAETRRQREMGIEDNLVGLRALIPGDDVFATLFQILHYKLHNDRWRADASSTNSTTAAHTKKFGLPSKCMGGHI